jgi:GNAT superfamily N-acetyltransferase
MRAGVAGEFTVRPATPADIPALVRHRCEMFKDMDTLAPEDYPALAVAAAEYYAAALPGGQYYGWVASPAGAPERIVAGGGVQLRPSMPRPGRRGGVQPAGMQALIVNVYTDPAWRRQGLAELIMRTILAWCQETGMVSVALHASSQGRPLYERLGFEASNEMYFPL